MTVYFIGAGPGDPELITVKGRRLIQQCPVCLYAGSLVPQGLVECTPPGATVLDTAQMTLDEITDQFVAADRQGQDVARVHSGDPSLYGAIAEQIRRLENAGISYSIVPGVPAFAAAAAECGIELTIPEVAQTVILTRTSMKSTSMPSSEDLEVLARSKATMAIHLSIRNTRAVQRKLSPIYGEDCPSVIAYRVGWPDQKIIWTDLASLHAEARRHKLTRTALILVGRAIKPHGFKDSALYDAAHPHVLRPFTGNRQAGLPDSGRPDKSHERMNR